MKKISLHFFAVKVIPFQVLSKIIFCFYKKMDKIIIAPGFRQETFTDIMSLYPNKKAMVHSSDKDTDFFNKVKKKLILTLE